jgi:hypothetical protein
MRALLMINNGMFTESKGTTDIKFCPGAELL